MLPRTTSTSMRGKNDEEWQGKCSRRDMEDSKLSNFKVEQEYRKKPNKGGPVSRELKGSLSPVGLRILIHRSGRESNVLNKPIMVQPTPINATSLFPYIPQSSFLQACHLCKKKFSPNKDVYMYRGDQGFCSVECRCRQIFLDEMEEREAFVKQRTVLPPRCRRRGNPVQLSDHRRRRIPTMA